jgi:hypothetical protein
MALTPEVRTTEGDALVAYTISTPDLRLTQASPLVAINFPTISQRSTQLGGLVGLKTDTVLRTTASFGLVAIIRNAQERVIRAWTFTQDDHDFYVLLASNETYVYDKLTDQWSQWASPDATFWRGVDGCDWEGINICIDPDSGKLFKIDPTNRLDYNTTPITSIVYGGMTERFRNMIPCYMAELAISQANPPAGILGTTLGIKLETTDTVDSINHGTVQGSLAGSRMTARWYGLGLIGSPGILFKITDTGYARRIDGLNIEVAGTPSNG